MVVLSDEALSDRICTLAAHIDAALCEWLELVAEFDRREGWADSGATSCANWLAFTCSISPRTAREHVRVASRLAGLPLTTAAFRRGELSYSKVRAITRVDGVEREAELVDLARAASAAQLDQIVRAHTRCIAVEQPDVRRRFVSLDEDEDGMWVLRGRLGAEEAAVVAEALRRAEERALADASGRARRLGDRRAERRFTGPPGGDGSRRCRRPRGRGRGTRSLRAGRRRPAGGRNRAPALL
jgi:uncharacterized protein DUF222